MLYNGDSTVIKVKVMFISQSHLPGENAAQVSAAVTIHTKQIFVLPGTHYCWVDRGGVDSKLAQGFDTSALREGNRTPDPLISGPMP